MKIRNLAKINLPLIDLEEEGLKLSHMLGLALTYIFQFAFVLLLISSGKKIRSDNNDWLAMTEVAALLASLGIFQFSASSQHANAQQLKNERMALSETQTRYLIANLNTLKSEAENLHNTVEKSFEKFPSITKLVIRYLQTIDQLLSRISQLIKTMQDDEEIKPKEYYKYHQEYRDLANLYNDLLGDLKGLEKLRLCTAEELEKLKQERMGAQKKD